MAEYLGVGTGAAPLEDAVIVVSDAEPTGAIAAAPLAAFGSLPLLATPAEELHPGTAGFIADNEIGRVLLVLCPQTFVGFESGKSPEFKGFDTCMSAQTFADTALVGSATQH